MLTTDQVKGLTVAGPLTGLSTAQVAALTAAQVAALTTTQVAGLTTAQVAAIEVQDLSGMGTAQISALTSAQLSSFTNNQVAALTTEQVQALSTANFAGLTSSFIQAMEMTDIQAFTTAQIVAMDSSHIGSLLPSQIGALTTAQISAIQPADLAGLTSNQIKAITATDLVAMTTAQITSLTTTQLGFLTAAQDATLTNEQWTAMSAAQRTAAGTPLILDLGGDGIHTTSIDQGITFDLMATGSRVPTGWVGAGDGLLVRDLNRNNLIDSGSELFGDSTVLPDGTKALDGFQALAALDSDHNGLIDANDTSFNELQIWQDVNQDGISQADELHSLAELSIKSISLGFNPVSQDEAGNWIGLESTYQTTDEETHKLVDVWFKLS